MSAASAGPRILTVAAPYYADIVAELQAGARAALQAAGAQWEELSAPGAFEIPAVIAAAARGGAGYDGYLALGCVIRGETTHYDYVCGESARGLMSLAVGEGLAIGYGILTVENQEQAWARARRDGKDKGGEAARACLAMIDMYAQFANKR